MKITVLGSGTTTSDYKRNPSGYLLEKDELSAVLDMGPGILKQLKLLKKNLLGINTIFISHFHLDHSADVFPVMMNRYLLDNASNNHLTIAGPAGLTEWFNTIASTQGSWLSENIPSLVELGEISYDWAGLSISVMPTGHTRESIAFRFSGEKSFFYSGDTGYNIGLTGLAADADMGILECSVPEELKTPRHLSPSEAGRLATAARIKHLVISHVNPENDTKDLSSGISKYYPGKITIAEDFMILNC
ncbi:MAG: MBL fold metallo-hydrolase [Calditrichaceae bacterium]